MEGIKKRHRALKSNWEILQYTMKASLTKEEQDAENYDKKIEDLLREDKELKSKPLWFLLQAVSGPGCIAWDIALSLRAGASIMGPASVLGVGVILGVCTWAYSTYSTKERLDKGILKYKKLVKECREKVEILQSALPIIENITQSLTKLVDLSEGVFRNLDAVCVWRETYKNCFAGLQPSLVDKWGDTKVKCEAYLALTKDEDEGTSSEVASGEVDSDHAVPDAAL